MILQDTVFFIMIMFLFPHAKAKSPTAGIGWSKTGSVKMEKVLSEPTTVSFNHIWSKLVVLFLWHVVDCDVVISCE